MLDVGPRQEHPPKPHATRLQWAQRMAAYAFIFGAVPTILTVIFYFSRDTWGDNGRWLLVYFGIVVLFTVRGRFRASWGFMELVLGAGAVAALLPAHVPSFSELVAALRVESELARSVGVLVGLVASLKGMDTIDKAITTDWENQELGGFRSEVRNVWLAVTKLSRPKKRSPDAVFEDEAVASGSETPSASQGAAGGAIEHAVNLDTLAPNPSEYVPADLAHFPYVSARVRGAGEEARP